MTYYYEQGCRAALEKVGFDPRADLAAFNPAAETQAAMGRKGMNYSFRGGPGEAARQQELGKIIEQARKAGPKPRPGWFQTVRRFFRK
jgi:hypothetical protein